MNGTLLNEQPQFAAMGDSALMVTVGDSISYDINKKVHDIISLIKLEDWPGIKEIVPTYSSFVVHFNPIIFSMEGLVECVQGIWNDDLNSENRDSRIVLIPTLYGSEYGPDLESVSEMTGLPIQEVIEIHSKVDYLVYALGFSPGFPYLGGLDSKIHCPRLETPRVSVPQGAVAIADSQTGVYPVTSPGGWRLIGRTPVKMFDPSRANPSLVTPGDYIRFVPIGSNDEFAEILEKSAQGTFEVEVQ